MKWMWISGAMLFANATLGDAAFIDVEKRLVFPQELAGMQCLKSEKYNNEDLGFSVFYAENPYLTAEVSMLTMGRSAIGTGQDAEGVDVVLDGLAAMLNRENKDGLVSGLRKRGTVEVPKDGRLKFLNTVFQYAEPRVVDGVTNSVPRIASFYATAARDHFVKVDLRFDLVDGDKARNASRRLVEELTEILQSEPSGEEMLLMACDAALYNPSDYGGRVAAQHVLDHAKTMGNLNVYSEFFVWQQGYRTPKNAELLIAGYFAGMLRVVVPQNLEEGGEYEGFLGMLAAYDAMRRRGDIESIPRLDEWVQAEDKAALYRQLLVEFEYLAPE